MAARNPATPAPMTRNSGFIRGGTRTCTRGSRRHTTWYNRGLIHAVGTAQRTYNAIIERGCLGRVSEFLPADATTIFVVSEKRVWERYGAQIASTLPRHEV